eukprot:364644-Chlamydomonas_euryale.AAC.9
MGWLEEGGGAACERPPSARAPPAAQYAHLRDEKGRPSAAGCLAAERCYAADEEGGARVLEPAVGAAPKHSSLATRHATRRAAKCGRARAAHRAIAGSLTTKDRSTAATRAMGLGLQSCSGRRHFKLSLWGRGQNSGLREWRVPRLAEESRQWHGPSPRRPLLRHAVRDERCVQVQDGCLDWDIIPGYIPKVLCEGACRHQGRRKGAERPNEPPQPRQTRDEEAAHEESASEAAATMR